MSNLDLGVIGNCAISALVDRRADIVWSCLPRLDGDPVFHALVDARPQDETLRGIWRIELEGCAQTDQSYAGNSAVLITRLTAGDGAMIEITDFCPRFELNGRMFRPRMLVRRIRPLSGSPRIRIRARPSFDYGAQSPQLSHGSNHIRYVGPHQVLRLTTDAPLTYVLDESAFVLEEPVNLLLGPDETLRDSVEATAREFQEQTEAWWKHWVRRLALPLEWQDAVIRAAITLKLSSFEETGAIVAAMTTSIPEAPNSGRNWDYRYCWLRDAFLVVRALNALSEVDTMEHYLRFIANIVGAAPDGHLQPVYGIGLEKRFTEREVASLAGYRGMGPVRVGNQAHEHFQHDVYGHVVLASAQAFFDRRLLRPFGAAEFERLERVGEQAYKVHNTPDAGMWELRTRARVHTSSVLMCWAACDRLAKIAAHLGRAPRAQLWRNRAGEISALIERRAWNDGLDSYAESLDGADVDAGLLLMSGVSYLEPGHPCFTATVTAIEKRLRRGRYLLRYDTPDDFGTPQTAFTLCTFWFIEALARTGRREEAREWFKHMLECRNHLGLLSEDMDPASRELWGNYPQTYSMVGLINAAVCLSADWRSVV